MKSLATFVAPLVGGGAASTVQGAAEGVGGAIRRIGERRADVNVPVKPSGQPYNRADTERAAGDFQRSATGNPSTIAQDIRENAGALARPQRLGETPIEPSQVPTTGLLSRDPGLVAAETAARTRNSGDFIQRDQNVKEAAGERVSSLRDPEADQGAVASVAQRERYKRVGAADFEIGRLQSRNDRMNSMFDDWVAPFNVIANSEAKGNASRNLDRTIVDENYVPARTEKNRQFDEAPGRSEQIPADDVFGAIDRVRAGINQLGPQNQQMPAEFVQRLDRLRPRFNEDGENKIGNLVKSDPAAQRGWKAAVSEVLADRVQSTRKIGETPEVQYARLAKEFKDNEAILAKVYSPEEMNNLRQAHKLLGYFKEAEKRATTGSPTAERTIPQWVQLAARHVYGDLKGGGIVKRFKLLLDLLPTNKQNADEIVQMAWFNPDVAAYLLEKPVRNRLIAVDNAARESGK
ncbi:hypothetical protein ASC80_05510 [Afipia sp. Root123D2]|uniref:hypothetical protein n=1 Tax=Afipia sp. Root123D2 TaxID=1736436 RepID=UPI0006F25570|nr:hypothetical protein [Afipia sp. Root123D2]KQW22797.1 hypothetical protein ASC80_05510 [Afipia sp. Root123D2]